MTARNDDLGPALAEICEAAAELILPLWRSGLDVDHKHDASPVTEAARRGETLILDALAVRFPDIPVVSEEAASEFGTPESIGPRFFLVDPLDGTKAFVRGDPNFTVNIALIDDGRSVAGAITAPVTGETWFTSGGRTLKRRVGETGGAPVHVRAWPDSGSVALLSHTMKPEMLAELKGVYGFDQSQAMDSSIKLCRVAEGAADVYPRHGPTM